tara:strand:- start:126 stop:1130 length:1005 start_codon:yes stop_codon:yes gene_type:complete
MTIVLGDIGGTNARLAFSNSDSDGLKEPKIFNCIDFPTIEDLLTHYCKISEISPNSLSLAVAGPVLDDLVKLTNGNWEFSKQKIMKNFKLDRAVFINDFTAQAYAQVPFFSGGYKIENWEKEQSKPIGKLIEGTSNQNGPLLILGPGTGLGVATLVFGKNEIIVLQGEGGQVHFTPRSDLEAEMYLWLRKENKNVSAEEVISGRGLVNIYRFLKEKENLPNMNEGGNPLSAEAIGEAALKGNEVCMKAVKLMFGILGTVAANGVLTNGSWGGVIIAGGITPKLIDLFKASPFQENFSSHEVYRKLLERVSVYIFSDPLGGLKGAQIAFSKMLEE